MGNFGTLKSSLVLDGVKYRAEFEIAGAICHHEQGQCEGKSQHKVEI